MGLRGSRITTDRPEWGAGEGAQGGRAGIRASRDSRDGHLGREPSGRMLPLGRIPLPTQRGDSDKVPPEGSEEGERLPDREQLGGASCFMTHTARF